MNNNVQERRPSPWRKPVILGLKLALGIALMLWLFWNGRFDPRVYRAVIATHTAYCLLFVLLGQWTMLLLPLVRWWLLVRAQGLRITLGKAVRIGLMGAFTNLFVPGGLGIDGVRLLYLRQFYRDQWIGGFSSVILDRALGILGLVILGGACGIILLAHTYSQWVLRLVLVSVLLVLGLIIGISVACGFLGVRSPTVFRRIHFVNRVLEAMEVYRGHKWVLSCGLLISIVGHLGVGITAYFGFLWLGYPSSLRVFIVTPILTMARAIPLTPLGLGVTDSLAAVLYPLVGLEGGAEVQMLLRGTITLVFLTCGLACLKDRAEVSAAEQQPVAESEEVLVGGSV